MVRLMDSRQQLTYILEDIRAIRSAALMADENPDWDTEGDVVRLIALATGPIMEDVERVIADFDRVIHSKDEEAIQDA